MVAHLNNRMHASLLTVIVSYLWFMSIASATVQTPNLSGTWRLDQTLSQFTPPLFGIGRGGPSADSLYVTHAANGMVTVGTETNGGQAWVYRIGTNSDVMWGQEGALTLISQWEDTQLIAQGSRGLDDDAEHIREIFSLSVDGKTLTVEVTITTTESTRTNRAVYQKADSVGPCEKWETPCVR